MSKKTNSNFLPTKKHLARVLLLFAMYPDSLPEKYCNMPQIGDGQTPEESKIRNRSYAVPGYTSVCLF
jgi:hypothetical protein